MIKIFKKYSPILSILAIIISCYSLYITRLKPSKITIETGENIYIHYFKKGNVGVTLPVSFTNSGAVFKTIKNLALVIQLPGNSTHYQCEFLRTTKLDEKGNIIADSTGPIAIPPFTTITRGVIFRSSSDPNDFYINKYGNYSMFLVGCVENLQQPEVMDSFSIYISDKQLAELKKCRKTGSISAIRFRQTKWKNWRAHYLSDIEIEALHKNISANKSNF